jgi:type IV secretory pathway VirB10-like protein
MNSRRLSSLLSAVLFLTLVSRLSAAPTEIKGAAILAHPCGKVAVKHMGLAHAGKIEEATKLGTKEMQEQWKALPAEDRKMMSGMMKEMAKTEAEFSAEIKASGLLVVDGKDATLTVKQEHKDANGSSTETMTQHYVLDGATCLISR